MKQFRHQQTSPMRTKHLRFAVLFILLIPFNVQAEKNFVKQNNFYFEIISRDPNQMICYGYYGTSKTITIPNSVTYKKEKYKVVSVKGALDGTCYHCSTSVWRKNVKAGRFTYFNLPDCVENIIISDGISLENNSVTNGFCGKYFGIFEDYNNLKSVTLPSDLKGIPHATFVNCKSLTKILIPNQVEKIGCYAFFGCPIVVLRIPQSVSQIEYDFVRECSLLRGITVHGSNSYFSSYDGALYNKDQTELITCPEGKTGTLRIAAATTKVSTKFKGCAIEHIIDNGVAQYTEFGGREWNSPYFEDNRPDFSGTIHLPFENQQDPINSYANYFPEDSIPVNDIEYGIVGEPISINITDAFCDRENDSFTISAWPGTIHKLYTWNGIQYWYRYTSTELSNTPIDVCLMADDGYGRAYSYFKINSIVNPIDGEITFSYSEPMLQRKITATLSNSTYNINDISYQWKLDGTDIQGATENFYTPVINDIDKILSVEITGNSGGGSVNASAGIVLRRFCQYTAPEAPILVSKTATSVTLAEIDNIEYAISGGEWQSSPVFENLTPNTFYSFIQRYAQTTIYQASEISPALTVVTNNTQKSAQLITNISTKSTVEKAPKIYPNPSDGNITIEFDGENQSTEIYIYNIKGALIFNTKIENEHLIKVDNLKQGQYIVHTISGTTVNTQKFIVK